MIAPGAAEKRASGVEDLRSCDMGESTKAAWVVEPDAMRRDRQGGWD